MQLPYAKPEHDKKLAFPDQCWHLRPINTRNNCQSSRVGGWVYSNGSRDRWQMICKFWKGSSSSEKWTRRESKHCQWDNSLRLFMTTRMCFLLFFAALYMVNCVAFTDLIQEDSAMQTLPTGWNVFHWNYSQPYHSCSANTKCYKVEMRGMTGVQWVWERFCCSI